MEIASSSLELELKAAILYAKKKKNVERIKKASELYKKFLKSLNPEEYYYSSARKDFLKLLGIKTKETMEDYVEQTTETTKRNKISVYLSHLLKMFMVSLTAFFITSIHIKTQKPLTEEERNIINKYSYTNMAEMIEMSKASKEIYISNKSVNIDDLFEKIKALSKDNPYLLVMPNFKSYLFLEGTLTDSFKIAIGKNGWGFGKGSARTPTGLFEIISYRDLRGKVAKNVITHGLFALNGLEEKNKETIHRGISIHGVVDEETMLGGFMSGGCIRMEKKGIDALAKIYKKYKNIKVIIMPSNGYETTPFIDSLVNTIVKK